LLKTAWRHCATEAASATPSLPEMD